METKRKREGGIENRRVCREKEIKERASLSLTQVNVRVPLVGLE